MNKYLKVIDTVGKIQEFERDVHIPREVPIGFKLKYQKEFGLLLELASKSTPIKPTLFKPLKTFNGSDIEQPFYIIKCGKCEYWLEHSDKFCSNCGTEIDWNEE